MLQCRGETVYVNKNGVTYVGRLDECDDSSVTLAPAVIVVFKGREGVTISARLLRVAVLTPDALYRPADEGEVRHECIQLEIDGLSQLTPG